MNRIVLLGLLVVPLLAQALLGSPAPAKPSQAHQHSAKAEPEKRLQWWQSAL